MKIKFEWESLSHKEHSQKNIIEEISRVKVFGGWLIRYSSLISNQINVCLTFVPDKNHEWEK